MPRRVQITRSRPWRRAARNHKPLGERTHPVNTTTASTQPQAILETYGRDLRAFLRAVVVHAKRDPFLPPWLAALGLVQFEVHGSTLLAVACDGLSLGVARAEVEPAAPDVAFTVRVSALALE